MSLRVLEPGLHSMLVDLGRPNWRSLGVPIGGAADRTALLLANALLGNPPDCVALEISGRGPTLQADSTLGGVLFGADFDVATDRREMSAGTTFTLEPEEMLRIRGARRGYRAYLAVVGGFHAPQVLDSRSAFERIVDEVELVCGSSTMARRFLSAEAPATYRRADLPVLRCLPGPQADWFHSARFFGGDYKVAPASNRMGLRLTGVALDRPTCEMISEPVCPGSVQVTNDGQCIVLGVDGQTIGGYAKIAQVILADLDKLGQLRPNDSIRFQSVTLEEAEIAWLRQRDNLNTWLARLAVMTDCSGILHSPRL